MKPAAFMLASLLSLTSVASAQPVSEAPAPSPQPVADQAAPAEPAQPQPTPEPEAAVAAQPAQPAVDGDGAAPEPTQAAEAAGAEEEPNMDLSLAELEALDLGGDTEGVDTSLMLSGFMDVTLIAPLDAGSVTTQSVAGKETSFMLGSLNVYLQKRINANIRTMAEIRFLYLPNGYEGHLGSLITTDTERTDYASISEHLKWGGIEIERAYLDWTPHALLSVRLGQFLTPYGIWNVDHGSPVVIATQRPYAVSGAFIPERQTGVQVYGRWEASSDTTAGYHLTLSNGAGSLAEYRDFDANKALGGRLYAEYRGLGQASAGVSGYYGRETFAEPELAVMADGIGIDYDIDIQADVAAMAVDLQWKLEGLQLQGEWVGRNVRYTDEGRTVTPLAGQIGVPRSAMYADAFEWSGYGLVGYRLPWLGIMPFATIEHMSRNYYALDMFVTWSQLGVNVRPVGEVVIKAEILKTLSASGLVGKPTLFQAQVAWVF